MLRASALPKIPTRKPKGSRETSRLLKDIAEWLLRNAETLARVAKMGAWVWEYKDDILSYLDPPKSLGELQNAAMQPRRNGYQDHHIAEQAAARQDGYSNELIEGPDNIVRIPTLRHQEINGWYGRKNPDFGWQSPREYLRGKPWSERVRIGHEALIRHGVLKP